jgi:hypothetical protein
MTAVPGCSISMPTLAAFWRTSPTPAVIVAESLRRMPEPPLVQPPSPVNAPAKVAAAIARALAPPLASDPAPDWLLEGQVTSFRRGLAALRRFGAAMVAEPAGSGKTWIGLALAHAVEGRAVAIVPAAVASQWAGAAKRAGVAVTIQTHEAWSRRARALPGGLVIIDESHRFRHPGIRRYVHLASALRGRTGVLLTATPVVNRLDDAAHQLLLLARDDALAAAGVPSLSQALGSGGAPSQLADLIVSGGGDRGRPRARRRELAAGPEEETLARAALTRLDRCILSRDPGVRSLLGSVLAAALGSSPAALRAALHRYRALLLQQADAAGSGRPVGRRELARLLGPDLHQTVLWALLDPGAGAADLVPDDLPALDACLAWIDSLDPGRDPKADRLASVLADGQPTIVFTSARATVRHLRQIIQPVSRVGWCTGAESGIGRTRLPRPDVLRWFTPGSAVHELAPRVLVATDVAAEGLDLQRATRIVHYDLPWTAVRLDQRAGRILRLGSIHASADIVTLLPPPSIESRLQLLARLARKRPLPSRLGLGPDPEPGWHWRTRLAESWRDLPALSGGAVARTGPEAALAGIALVSGTDVVTHFAVAREGGGRWSSNHELVDRLLERARESAAGTVDSAILAAAARSLSREARLALLGATGSLWRIRPLGSWARPALTRLRGLVAEAVRRRDLTALAFADRAISFLRRGHTAGERQLAIRLATAADSELQELLSRLPVPDPLPPPIRPVITGLIVFRP